jgi:hypothetical protein
MRLVPMVIIIIVAWLLIIGEVYLFFDVIVAFTPPIHQLGSLTALALLKVVSTLGLGAVWFLVMSTLAELYTGSRIRRLTPRPSS